MSSVRRCAVSLANFKQECVFSRPGKKCLDWSINQRSKPVISGHCNAISSCECAYTVEWLNDCIGTSLTKLYEQTIFLSLPNRLSVWMREICKESSCVRFNLRFLSLCIFSSCLQIISSLRGVSPQTSWDNLIVVYPNVKTPFAILNWGMAFRHNFVSMVEHFAVFIRDDIGHDFAKRLCLLHLAIWNH